MEPDRCLRILVFFLVVLTAAWGAAAENRFTDNGDGTVSDHELGLMWAKADNSGDIDWHQAEKWVMFTFPFTIGKQFGDWRLPTLTELQSLADQREGQSGYETDCGQRVKLSAPIRLSCGWVWTSETDASAPTAQVFNFSNDSHYKVRKAYSRGYRALAVRSLK